MRDIVLKSFTEVGKKRFWYSLLFDVIFTLSAVILSLALSTLNASRTAQGLLIFFTVTYVTLVLLAYSYFKFKILALFYTPKAGFWKFYLLNLILIAVIGFSTLVAYLLVQYFIAESFQKIYFSLLVIIISVIGYVFINVMQVIKFTGKSVDDAFRVTGRNIFPLCLLFILESVLFGLIYLIYFALYTITKGHVNLNMIFQMTALIMILVLNAFNRIVFVKTAEKRSNQT